MNQHYPSWGVQIAADSINAKGDRLTTFCATYPRFIHSELMTHRTFARNAASSRAIPIERMIEIVRNNPAMPIFWGKNQPGMQAFEQISPEKIEEAKTLILGGAEQMIELAGKLVGIGLHKQNANRYLEPFAWITTIISATDWNNFFHQRYSPLAQPEFLALARQMAILYEESKPRKVDPQAPINTHLPLIDLSPNGDIIEVEAILCGNQGKEMSRGEAGWEQVDWWLKRVSAARCARVSYLNHGAGKTIGEDLALYRRLSENGHWSPLEHVADPISSKCGPFTGWKQFRKHFVNENRTDPFSAWQAEQHLIEQGWNIEILQAPFAQ